MVHAGAGIKPSQNMHGRWASGGAATSSGRSVRAEGKEKGKEEKATQLKVALPWRGDRRTGTRHDAAGGRAPRRERRRAVS